MKIATVSLAVLGFGFMGLASAPAAAQGTMEPFAKPRPNAGCPSGWTDRVRGTNQSGGTCYPGQSARPSYFANGNPCASGYGRSNSYCIEGADQDLTRASTGTLVKANRLDRCPISYFTNQENPANCISLAANATTARLKGSAPCRTGEVDDWGIYCVSNYTGLRREDAAMGTRDWNAIYAAGLIAGTSGTPRQADLPEGTEYTPAYFTIFGRVKPDGTPLSGSARAAAPAAAATPATATQPVRIGSMSPQRRNLSSFNMCPTEWVQGMAGQRGMPDPNMCYPGPNATPIYSVPSQNTECPIDHMNSMSWCVALPGTAAATRSASQPSQQSSQTPTNCPAPASGAAAQIGSQLGGLLGGRRGNSQAGAALGGLLGAAAGAAKPAGCP